MGTAGFDAAATDLPDALRALEAALDDLRCCDLKREVDGIFDAVEVVERARRRLDAIEVNLLAEVGLRHLAGDYGAASIPALLTQRLKVTPGEARARVRRASDLGPRQALTGEPLTPILPECAAALARGDLSSAHVRVITATLDRIPADIAHDAAPVAERFLAHAAEHENPRQLAQSATALMLRLDPDGREPVLHDQQRRRDVTLSPCSDGGSRPVGYLTPECTAVWQAILGALGAPAPGVDGEPDPRSPGQRRHDALLDAGQRLLRSGSLPDTGGIPVTVLVQTTADALEHRDGSMNTAGLARTEHGELLTTGQLHALGSDGAMQTVLTDHAGQVLCYGRTRRFATPGQRRALTVRDGGCSFPHCTRPASWCEAHHVYPWKLGGPTDIDNLTLLCGYHHREHERQGWSVRIHDGLPYWTPPHWLDPDRVPMRNTSQHLRDIDLSDWPDPDRQPVGAGV